MLFLYCVLFCTLSSKSSSRKKNSSETTPLCWEIYIYIYIDSNVFKTNVIKFVSIYTDTIAKNYPPSFARGKLHKYRACLKINNATL